MNLRAGTVIVIEVSRWTEDVHPDDRTPQNAFKWAEALLVDRCEWLPRHQRMVVRLRDQQHRELFLTPHELEINGATQ